MVLGGTSGMGLATARYLAAEGATVIVTGHGDTDVTDLTVIKSDLADLAQLRALPAAIGAPIDLLFVNAGINLAAPLQDTDEAAYDRVFALNAKGPFFAVQVLAPHIVDGGAIVFTTSVANVKGLPGASAYAATKAATRSMVRSFARELLPRRIRVNAVSPGPIDTQILTKTLGEAAGEQARAQFRDTNPMKRLGAPDEIARAVAFLGFEATYTTGAELPVDGGASQL